jgi:hypothetical protein
VGPQGLPGRPPLLTVDAMEYIELMGLLIIFGVIAAIVIRSR